MITIEGKPIAQARHRVVRRGNFVASYDPQAKLKAQALLQAGYQQLLHPPILCELTAYMPIPKSYSKKKKEELRGQPHSKRPDVDNIAKFYLDTFGGVCYEDDGHVSTLVAKKVYSDKPRVEITFTNDKN